ncbi:NfeD family protein [Thioalkalivibrio thiocyanodenitrificans]|uniref:NfeD family protein n=1 Tax=Thioalkalivibrio thiocyanodenitrificans TaxID=243063 RepID=UPI0012EA2DA1|nr:nodulation protein NfeD [Thioalkalivibrio thiocyanodenitrificans]
MFRLLVWGFLFLLGAGLALGVSGQDDRRTAVLLEISGAIGPATSDYVVRGIRQARDDGAEVVILRMDTPGGLDTAMREIIKEILSSPVPVASYVSPPGSRAASAGTYILYASHIAAMAPATNLGSATPVQIGGVPGMPDDQQDRPDRSRGQADENEASDNGDEAAAGEEDAEERAQPRRGADAMERKVLEDAVAYIRGLAERHGRNADWAEEAVREAVNLTATEALEKNVIDVVAESVADLLEQIHGRTVKMEVGERVLDTENLQVVEIEPDWRSRLLSVITNPNIAYILMMVGIYGIIFELANPGNIFPGVVGVICLVLALYAFQVLPINYAGLALILLGIVLMIAEAFAPSFGILGFGGIAAFVLGSIILMDEATLNISIPLIGGVALVSAAFFIWILSRLFGIRRRKVVTGQEEMIGLEGTAVEDFEGNKGRVWLHSESWSAESPVPVYGGDPVKVTGMKGLRLEVEPVAEQTDTNKGAAT